MLIEKDSRCWYGRPISQVCSFPDGRANFFNDWFFYRRIEGPVMMKGQKTSNAYQVISRILTIHSE